MEPNLIVEMMWTLLYNTIEWQIALPLMGIGGKRIKVIIHQNLLMPAQKSSGRKNAVLAFDIELINFK